MKIVVLVVLTVGIVFNNHSTKGGFIFLKFHASIHHYTQKKNHHPLLFVAQLPTYQNGHDNQGR
jgi:hypothetical protein